MPRQQSRVQSALQPLEYHCPVSADFERVGWINEILSQIWPSVNSAVSQQFRDLLGPLLKQNKPSWIASLKLFRHFFLASSTLATKHEAFSGFYGSQM